MVRGKVCQEVEIFPENASSKKCQAFDKPQIRSVSLTLNNDRFVYFTQQRSHDVCVHGTIISFARQVRIHR